MLLLYTHIKYLRILLHNSDISHNSDILITFNALLNLPAKLKAQKIVLL